MAQRYIRPRKAEERSQHTTTNIFVNGENDADEDWKPCDFTFVFFPARNVFGIPEMIPV